MDLASTVFSAEEQQAAARQYLWGRANLKWALHSGQKEIYRYVQQKYEEGERRFVLLCGRRYGKTRYLVTEAFARALAKPNQRILYASLTWKSAVDYVLPEVQYLCEYAPDHLCPKVVGGDIRFPNGSVIVLRGCEDQAKANRLRGPKAHWAYVDEAGFIEDLDYVVNSVISWQLLTTDGGVTLASSPPLSAGHKFVQYLVDAEVKGTLIRRKTEDAPHVTPAILAKLCADMGGPKSTVWKREGLAQLVTDESKAVLPEFQDMEGVVVVPHASLTVPAFCFWFVAADLGYLDLTAILMAYYDFDRGKTVVISEKILRKPTSHDVQEATQKLEAEFSIIPETRVVDTSLFTIADLHKLQPEEEEARRWRPTRKDDREAAINAVRLALVRQQVEISDRCRTLIAHCRHAIWNTSRTQFSRSADDGHYDAVAALIYLIRSIDKTRNPYPQTPYISFNQHNPGVSPAPVAIIGSGKKRI
jgi:hypothetical protein